MGEDELAKLGPPFLGLHAAEWTSKNSFEIRDDARRFENWEFNYADVSGLKTAIEYADEIGIEKIWDRIIYLADYLRTELDKLSGVTVRDIGKTMGGIVTFSVDSMQPATVREKLWEHNINVHTASRSSTLIDMEERNLEEVVRASVHYFNTEDEIEKFVEVLKLLI
jgi:selenocysteine lyase/cysteine desulfurase